MLKRRSERDDEARHGVGISTSLTRTLCCDGDASSHVSTQLETRGEGEGRGSYWIRAGAAKS